MGRCARIIRYCMYCGVKYNLQSPSQITCHRCREVCIFCKQKIYKQNRNAFSICKSCILKRLNNFKHQCTTFDVRLRKKQLGPHQKIIADKIQPHFNIEECYRTGKFVIDLYFKDFDIFINFHNPEFIRKEGSNFGQSSEYFLEKIIMYKDAFMREFGKEIFYVYTTDLLPMNEEDVVKFFKNLFKSKSKITGEYIV